MRSFPIRFRAGRPHDPQPMRRLTTTLHAVVAVVRSAAGHDDASKFSDHMLRDIGLWRDRHGYIRSRHHGGSRDP